MRGEYHSPKWMLCCGCGSPPHARGIPWRLIVFIWEIRLTPACAGNTSLRLKSCKFHQAHPRMRGEYGLPALCTAYVSGSPPHARGIHLHLTSHYGQARLTPACAGEYLPVVWLLRGLQGSPPHARGILSSRRLHLVCPRLTPACAGNTAWHKPDTEIEAAHPRMRGEYLVPPVLLGA